MSWAWNDSVMRAAGSARTAAKRNENAQVSSHTARPTSIAENAKIASVAAPTTIWSRCGALVRMLLPPSS